jgi:hypothetical protein
MVNYNIEEHLHRFAVWTSARAVARNFTGTGNIQTALESVKKELIPFLEGQDDFICQESFDVWHRKIAQVLVQDLKKRVSDSKKVSHGRAAKILAVYLKTVYVLRFPESETSKFIHPPIDRVLLTNIQKRGGIKFKPFPNWTELDREEYIELIEQLRRFVGEEPFWKLEVFWNL